LRQGLLFSEGAAVMISKISKKVRNSMQSLHGSTRENAYHDSSVDGNENLERNIETPRSNDILLGRGRTSWSHTGNQQYRSFVGKYLKQYTETSSRSEKTRIVHLIYDEVTMSGGRFLKLDTNSNTWYQIGKLVAREKIGHTLRDAVGLRIKLNPNDEDESYFALNSNDSADHRRPGLCATPSASKSANSPSSKSVMPLITSSSEVSRTESRRRDASSCQEPTRRLPSTESSQLDIVVSTDNLTSDSLDLPSSKSKKYPTTSSKRKVKRDRVNDTKHSVSSHRFDRIIVEPQLSESSSQINDEIRFDRLVDSVLTDFVPPQDADHMSLTITSAAEDEFSAGFSAMSLETPKSGRSGKSGSCSKSKSNTNDGKSAFSLLTSTLQTSAIKQRSKNQPVHNHISKNSAQNSMTHLGESGKFASEHDENECDASMGVNSLDWAKTLGDAGETCSLDDFSLTSHQTKSTRGSGQTWSLSRIGRTDQSQESSEKSSGSENEWRKTLMALRRT
jgi:hypothetical protein